MMMTTTTTTIMMMIMMMIKWSIDIFHRAWNAIWVRCLGELLCILDQKCKMSRGPFTRREISFLLQYSLRSLSQTMSYITFSQQYMRYLLIIYPKQSPQPTFSAFLRQTNRTHELLAWWPVCSDSTLDNIRHPCKYAIACQTWARIGPMLPASGRFWPRSGRSVLLNDIES